MVPRVFSVPGLGCFQFPDSGLLFPEWCVGRPWVGLVFCSRNGVSGSRPEGTAWRCLWFPYGVSSCFFLLLCFFFVRCFLPFFSFSHFFRFCLASCYFCFLSSVPAFPLPFLLLLPGIFLRSFPFLLPALASFPSLSFPLRPLPEFPSRT